MTFSIVIPTFNGEKYISEAIESALSQTRPADEIIVSDDNSTDRTLEISSRYGDRIKIFKNLAGPSGFVNGWKNAIEKATSDYIAILHQDDLLYPEFLREMENAIKIYPATGHLFATCDYIDGSTRVIKEGANEGTIQLFTGKAYADCYQFTPGHIHRCPGVLTRQDIFQHCNYRVEAGHIADDDFFMRVGQFTNIVGILKPLAAYREHTDSETGRLSELKLNRRLHEDYIFQLNQRSSNPLISKKIVEEFKLRQTKLLHRLILGGLKEMNWECLSYGLRHWLRFDKRFGNLRFDVASLLRRIR